MFLSVTALPAVRSHSESVALWASEVSPSVLLAAISDAVAVAASKGVTGSSASSASSPSSSSSGRVVGGGSNKAPLQRKMSFSNRFFKDILARHGLLEDDPRIADIIRQLNENDGSVGGGSRRSKLGGKPAAGCCGGS